VVDYISALGFLGDPIYWLVLIAAVGLAGAAGLIPGIGTTTIAAIAIPLLVFNVADPVIALTFLAALGGVNNTLDSVPAILLGYPGAATQVTFLEGHQLAMRGQAAYTLGAVYAVSAIGGVVGAVVLLITMPFLRPILVRFSFPEIAAMALFGVLMVSVLSRGAMLKGLISGLTGILIGTAGISFIAGDSRFDLGTLYLYEGFPLIPTLIGVFALPELIDLTMRGQAISPPGSVSTAEVMRGARYGLSQWRMTLRQSLFGVFLGAVPGIGSAVVDWLAYAFGIGFARDKTTFGKGNIDGVLFAESAQNSKEGGQAIPTLAFGVPGGTAWAIVLAAMLIYGVTPGLGMLGTHLNITLSLVVTLALGNLLITMLGLVFTGQIAKLTLVPYPLLAAALIPLVFIAAYQTSNNWGDIMTVCGMTILGLTMKWLGWPRPPLILGFILGPIIERNLWPSVQVWGFGMIIRPISLTLVVLGVLAVLYMTKAMGRSGAAATAVASSELSGELAAAGGIAGDAPPGLSATDVTPSGDGDPAAAQAGSGDAPMGGPAVGGAAVATATPAGGLLGLRMPSLSFTWHWEVIFPAVLLAIAVWALIEAQSFAIASSKFLPTWMALLIIPLLAIQIIGRLLSPHAQGEIMDLGMRTGTGFDAVKRLAYVFSWLAGYILAIGIFGMEYASIAFAFGFAVFTLDWGWPKKLWSILPAAIIATVIFGFFNPVMFTQWPDLIIVDFFRGLG
jgi:TctA family transporter